MSNHNGALYVVATPIGNLGDLSPRAVETLRAVNVIAAEDTRHSGKLLQHFGIVTPCTALHEHNERRASAKLIQRMAQGESVALISDAGTPLLSDPGYHLVAAAHAQGIPVVPIPGPSSLVTALSASGLQADSFVFEGFLPAKQAARRARLDALRAESRTLVFFETPHRILAALRDLQEAVGEDRVIVIARELTKAFETIRRGSTRDVLAWMGADPNQQRGEFVVMVQGSPRAPVAVADDEARRVLTVLLAELPLKQAVTLAARLTGYGRNHLYDLAVELQDLDSAE
ncbi:MAG: hypothetical protein FD165_1655 [Gammaproteobacteria bacterium]|nr:MAG: hypothetical protein FD165_1655 [Gammaproteobacteria bacterium]TND02697.1 MAG: hypothetical protein FD120_2158 [Gammaproteobacteria bacterium]